MVKAFGCKVCAGFVDAESIRTGDAQAILSTQVGIDVPPIPVGDLHHGDVIDIGAHRLQILETPGHTRGGVCYLDEVTSSLFSGDTLFSNSVGRTDFYGGSLASLRNSIKYLRDIAFKDLYPGHGDPTSDGPLAIKIGLQIVGD